MSKELVIGSNRHETKVALLEDDQLVELYFQRANEYSLAGSIHKGRVTRVLPGMQSAFVDLGLERDTFLYVTDFFEEHDDIDPVEERPSRPDRRDRHQGRGPDRGAEERAAAPRELRVITPEPTEEQGGETAEEETGIPPAEVAPPQSAGENRPGERSDVDRGMRGDRRGRRSRKRRNRGGGFPENKYAQPAGARTASPSLRDPRPYEQAEPTEDVIILPGESLAKYQHAAAGTEAAGTERFESDAFPEMHAEDEGEELSPEAEEIAEEEAAEREAIEEEAEALALSDKVLAHHDDPPIAVEQKIEEVKRDQPVSDVEDEQPGGNEQAMGVGEEPLQAGPFTVVETDAEAADIEDIPAARDEYETAEEEPADLEGGELGREPQPPGAQRAEVREQSGRYLHRVSRRMRRRGGNRFGQQRGGFGGGEASGGGTSAAAVMQPEARSEGRAEAQEDRPEAKFERAGTSISDLLRAGQEIIVQIAKEPLGQKGARITSHVALPGRFVVFMPSVNHLGVSRKIASDEERHRLKRILQAHRTGATGGFIVRTAGEGVPEEEIAADMNYLYSLWLEIREKAEKKPAPALLHYDLDIVQRVLRDQVTDEFKAIWVDNEEMYEHVVTFMQRFQPTLVNRVKMYTRPAPIFDAFNITPELEKALRPKVWLKSGGYIVINQTEALVAIDINTGKYVGKSNRLEDTIVKTNTEAVKEIVRQIRLRDLGGIIVVDFIDMDERKNRQRVMQALEEAMRADKAPYKILQFNDFGLVAITRKRVKQSLERTLCSPCPYCEGAGYVKSVHTVIGEILVEAQKIAKAIEGNDVVLRVHPSVAKVLKASNNQYLEELEQILRRPVLVTGDAALHHEKFDLG
jgi:ribonuclease G